MISFSYFVAWGPMSMCSRSTFWLVVLCTSTALAAMGCGGSTGGPELHPVTGSVKMDGAPVADARVIFTPKGGGVTAIGNTNSSGTYTLEYTGGARGAPAGEYGVSISTFRAGEVTDGDDSGGRPAKETIPDVYNQKTTLTVKVPDDAASYSFDLKASAGKVTEPPVPRGNN